MSSHPTQHEWNLWLEENAGRFLMFARQQTRSEHDAEDVLQEALVESWKRAGGRPDAALVFATIRRRAIDLGRRTDSRLRRERDHDGDALWFVLPPDDGEGEVLKDLERAVKSLPPPQRDVLSLKFWGGLTFAEISEALEIPQGTAASRYRTAMETLRHTLTPSFA